MSQQETNKNCIKLYANSAAIDSRFIKGEAADGVLGVTSMPSVLSSLVMINVFAIEQKMFPLMGPFRAFDYCKMSDLECIIIGGMPADDDEEKLKRWIGPSYAQEVSGGASPWANHLHEWICYNQYTTTYRITSVSKTLSVLQNNGVLLLPEILSTFVGGNKIMSKLWEPFIWNFLNEITTSRPEVPLIFTTESALEKFSSATTNSLFKELALIENFTEREENKSLKAAESAIKRNGRKTFNFFDYSIK